MLRDAPRLSVNDGFAFALAESHAGSILLAGDRDLRTLATKHEIEVHGLLWAIDEIHGNGLRTGKALLTALRILGKDPAVRLPRDEFEACIRRFESLR